MYLMTIGVDVIKPYGEKTCLPKSITSGVDSHTIYGRPESFVRILGLRTKEDVLGLSAYCWRDGVKAERRHVLILAFQGKRTCNWVGDFTLPNEVRSISLQERPCEWET